MYSKIIKKDSKKPEMEDMFEGKKLEIKKDDSEMAMKSLGSDIEEDMKQNRKPNSVDGLKIDLELQASKKKPKLNDAGEVPMKNFKDMDAKDQLDLLKSRKNRPMDKGEKDLTVPQPNVLQGFEDETSGKNKKRKDYLNRLKNRLEFQEYGA